VVFDEVVDDFVFSWFDLFGWEVLIVVEIGFGVGEVMVVLIEC